MNWRTGGCKCCRPILKSRRLRFRQAGWNLRIRSRSNSSPTSPAKSRSRAAWLTGRRQRVIEGHRVSKKIWNSRMSPIASNLQIDSARLWGTIHETAKFGATAQGGVRRLTLGPEDKQVRDWFRKACEAAGLEVHVDTLGSMFGLRKRRDMSKSPVGLASHLSTHPTGGKFHGVL